MISVFHRVWTGFDPSSLYSFDPSGRMKYLRVCEAQSVAPCSVFLRQAVEEKLNLKYYGLGAKQMKPLAMAFMVRIGENGKGIWCY